MVSIGTELKSEIAKNQGDLKNAIEENKGHPVFELAKCYWEYKYTMAKKRSELGYGIGGSNSGLEDRMDGHSTKLYFLYVLVFVCIMHLQVTPDPILISTRFCSLRGASKGHLPQSPNSRLTRFNLFLSRRTFNALNRKKT